MIAFTPRRPAALRRYGSLALLGALSLPLLTSKASAQIPWPGYGGNAQHTAQAPTAARPLERIVWKTPVDLNPQFSGNDLFIHYGSISITRNNLVLVPVKTGVEEGFRIEAHQGANGALSWQRNSSYLLPPHDWTPSFSGVLNTDTTYCYPEAGGTITRLTNLDSPTPSAERLAFYGIKTYLTNKAAYDQDVRINTPVTADAKGNLYFGVYVFSNSSLPLKSGLARIGADGTTAYIAAADAADGSVEKVTHNCAPALSGDGKIVYVTMNNGYGTGFGTGYLVALDSTTLMPLAKVRLKDVTNTQNDAYLPDDGTAAPTIGPDGDVYEGVLEWPFPANHARGWLLHFALTYDKTTQKYAFVSKTPGAFGWDDTASIVPASLVSAYKGKSSYLVLTKYNNYVSVNGDGANKVAILDPNAAMTDPISGQMVMKEVLTVTGVTKDGEFGNYPNAVREWCINSAAVDRFTKSALVNSEDGKLYRWDFATNSLTQTVTLTPGVGEAYTPTVVGPDGVTYAINNATLFAVGNQRAQTLAPIADATVKSGVDANTNFGGTGDLQIRAASPNAENYISYLKLDLTHIGTPPTSALLKLTTLASDAANKHFTLKVYSVANSTWFENLLTWNNAPGLDRLNRVSTGTLLLTKTLLAQPGFTTIDLTGFVNANLGKVVTLQFVGTATDSAVLSFRSKEAAGYANPLLLQY